MNYIARKIRLTCEMDQVNEWASYINLHLDEAIQSLRDEGVVHEMCFCGKDEQGLYIIGVMDCADLDKASKVAKKSQLSVDTVHQKFKQFWGEREKLLIDPKVAPNFPGTICMYDIRL